jgi:hypothetical protein
MSKPRATAFIPWKGEPPMIITEAWRDPSYRGQGRPRGRSLKSLAEAKAAAAFVLEQQAKRPHVKETTLIAEAVGKHGSFKASPAHVSEELKALKALRNKEK